MSRLNGKVKAATAFYESLSLKHDTPLLKKESDKKCSISVTPKRNKSGKTHFDVSIQKNNPELQRLKKENNELRQSKTIINNTYIGNQTIEKQVIQQQIIDSKQIINDSSQIVSTTNVNLQTIEKQVVKQTGSVKTGTLKFKFDSSFVYKVDKAINDRNHSSSELGEIGEKLVVQAFEILNTKHSEQLEIQRISVDQKHSGDILVKDLINNILFVVEVKNKQEISKDDIQKFNDDLQRLKSEYTDFVVVGLFISLYTKTINTTLKSFTPSFEKTYITRDYFTIEFLRMYIDSIRKQSSIERQIQVTDEDKEFIKTLKNQFDDMKFLTDQCAEIQEHINALQENLKNIQSKVVNKFNSTQNILEKYDSKNQEEEIIKRNIVRYCKDKNWSEQKILVKDVKNMIGTHNILPIKSGNIRRIDIIEFARKCMIQYGY